MSQVTVKEYADNMEIFWRAMAERHSIYKKRKAGEKPPWTEDKIYSSFKFTNCRSSSVNKNL